jgi:hypothetical protein
VAGNRLLGLGDLDAFVAFGKEVKMGGLDCVWHWRSRSRFRRGYRGRLFIAIENLYVEEA